MRKVYRLFRLGLLLFAFPFVDVAPPVRAQQGGLDAEHVARIRSSVQDVMTKLRVPGATFAIGRNGQVVWTDGFGYADIENQVRASAETRYRTASIGKAITATAAMMLAEQGKLELDIPIQKYCPQFPEKTWPITTRDLLSHTSGIRHYEGPNEQAELFNTRHYDHVTDALDIFKNDPLKQRPGDDMIYTTWGYVVLGCVIEGVTHEEFRGFISKTIFGPAGMSETRDDDPRAMIPHRARGYIFENDVLLNSRTVDMSSKMAAGGWITTASDLVRFVNAVMDGKFVSQATLREMLTPYRLPRDNGTVDGYGEGWFLEEYRGLRAGMHGGGTPQVSGIVLFVPDKRIAVAGIMNLEDVPAADRVKLAKAILDAAFE
jgi:CubicO group peptidase (beta-lactamase class C family)